MSAPSSDAAAAVPSIAGSARRTRPGMADRISMPSKCMELEGNTPRVLLSVVAGRRRRDRAVATTYNSEDDMENEGEGKGWRC